MSATSRSLTAGERELAKSIFRGSIEYDRVRLHHRKWIFFQPVKTTMAPDGDIWFHPESPYWRADFAGSNQEGHFIHEMTHVWQAQTKGRWYLPVARHPLSSYKYSYKPGKAFGSYGIEQQAEIVRHVFEQRRGRTPEGAAALELLEPLLPFHA